MAFQPETATWEVGVYQVEVTDPVQGGVGGVTNTPLLHLANRTKYLKQHIDAIESGAFLPPGFAPLNSPAFTGTPTAPTPPDGDSSTKIATTAFVQRLKSGIAVVNVAGGSNVSLVQSQWGLGIIQLTGIVTANINVIFPVNGQWIVLNSTTGAFTITCKTAAGAGVAITQGKSALIYGDGTDIRSGDDDIATETRRGIVELATAAETKTGTDTTRAVHPAGLKAALDAVDVGSIGFFPMSSAPAGYVKANGALLSRTTYAALWAFAQASGALNTEAAWSSGNSAGFSSGDGATTFRIPDLRGEFVRGLDDGRGVDPSRVLGSRQAASVLNGHVGNEANRLAISLGNPDTTATYSADGQVTTGSGGSAATHTAYSTRPRNVALLACIKF